LNANPAEQEKMKEEYINRFEKEYGIKLDKLLIALNEAMRRFSKEANNSM